MAEASTFCITKGIPLPSKKLQSEFRVPDQPTKKELDNLEYNQEPHLSLAQLRTNITKLHCKAHS